MTVQRPTLPPDVQSFTALAVAGTAVAVVRRLEASHHDPLSAFRVLAHGEDAAALLETAESSQARTADMSVVVPRATRVLRGADVLDRVQELVCDSVVVDGAVVAPPRFLGGVVGVLAHEFVAALEPTVPRASVPHPVATDEAMFLQVDSCVVFDHASGNVHAVAVVRVPRRLESFDPARAYGEACTELDRIDAALGATAPEPEVAPIPVDADLDPLGVVANVDDDAFRATVERAREHVRNGSCVQIVVSRRFETACDADPLLVYRAMRESSPAPYHVLLRVDGVHLVSASPEQLVGVRDERVVTYPIAGTRPRGVDCEHDMALETSLLADPKERSEHMMLVDLGRNDLARVAAPGTVRVEQLAQVERFSHVMHLVSRVTADLRPGLHPVDALRACFPAGTLTGAPKVRAMQLVAELEPQRRGLYGGVVGYIGHGRMLDVAITIRSAVLADGRAYVQAGAGVVAGSDPAAEADETRHKAHAALAAVAMANAATRRRLAVTPEQAHGGAA